MGVVGPVEMGRVPEVAVTAETDLVAAMAGQEGKAVQTAATVEMEVPAEAAAGMAVPAGTVAETAVAERAEMVAMAGGMGVW
ncbi:MAG TPA: hypothetical protein VNT79_02815, partial [Phycisphaerae bacterium]|nr:hypothetical protein [Phycisphaerae bacterium]